MRGHKLLSLLLIASLGQVMAAQDQRQEQMPTGKAPASSPVPASPTPSSGPKPSPNPSRVETPQFRFEGMSGNRTPPEGFQNSEGYFYDPTGKRDPFKPFGESQATLAPQLEIKRPLEPLEMYDIGQYKLVGIIWNVKDPKAMVRDPTGKLHMVRKETRIGRNNGFVASIREGELIVVEPTVGEDGMQTAVTRVLNLKR